MQSWKTKQDETKQLCHIFWDDATRGQGTASEKGKVPSAGMQSERRGIHFVHGWPDSRNVVWRDRWGSYSTRIHGYSQTVGLSSQDSEWLANNMAAFKEPHITIGISFPFFLPNYFKVIG